MAINISMGTPIVEFANKLNQQDREYGLQAGRLAGDQSARAYQLAMQDRGQMMDAAARQQQMGMQAYGQMGNLALGYAQAKDRSDLQWADLDRRTGRDEAQNELGQKKLDYNYAAMQQKGELALQALDSREGIAARHQQGLQEYGEQKAVTDRLRTLMRTDPALAKQVGMYQSQIAAIRRQTAYNPNAAVWGQKTIDGLMQQIGMAFKSAEDQSVLQDDAETKKFRSFQESRVRMNEAGEQDANGEIVYDINPRTGEKKREYIYDLQNPEHKQKVFDGMLKAFTKTVKKKGEDGDSTESFVDFDAAEAKLRDMEDQQRINIGLKPKWRKPEETGGKKTEVQTPFGPASVTTQRPLVTPQGMGKPEQLPMPKEGDWGQGFTPEAKKLMEQEGPPPPKWADTPEKAAAHKTIASLKQKIASGNASAGEREMYINALRGLGIIQ